MLRIALQRTEEARPQRGVSECSATGLDVLRSPPSVPRCSDLDYPAAASPACPASWGDTVGLAQLVNWSFGTTVSCRTRAFCRALRRRTTASASPMASWAPEWRLPVRISWSSPGLGHLAADGPDDDRHVAAPVPRRRCRRARPPIPDRVSAPRAMQRGSRSRASSRCKP